MARKWKTNHTTLMYLYLNKVREQPLLGHAIVCQEVTKEKKLSSRCIPQN